MKFEDRLKFVNCKELKPIDATTLHKPLGRKKHLKPIKSSPPPEAQI